jgi:hypothetical protein
MKILGKFKILLDSNLKLQEFRDFFSDLEFLIVEVSLWTTFMEVKFGRCLLQLASKPVAFA